MPSIEIVTSVRFQPFAFGNGDADTDAVGGFTLICSARSHMAM